jgi:hypothetical protein
LDGSLLAINMMDLHDDGNPSYPVHGHHWIVGQREPICLQASTSSDRAETVINISN